MTQQPNDIEALAAKATPGPWLYRPDQYDDWGIIKMEPNEEGHKWVIMQVRDPRYSDEECLNEHRRNKTDPWEANARLICELVNNLPTILTALRSTAQAAAPMAWPAYDTDIPDAFDGYVKEVSSMIGNFTCTSRMPATFRWHEALAHHRIAAVQAEGADNKAGGIWYRRWFRLAANNNQMREALSKVREYVTDHQEVQPNDETLSDLAMIDAALNLTSSGDCT